MGVRASLIEKASVGLTLPGVNPDTPIWEDQDIIGRLVVYHYVHIENIYLLLN